MMSADSDSAGLRFIRAIGDGLQQAIEDHEHEQHGPLRLYEAIGDVIAEAIVDHEQRCHTPAPSPSKRLDEPPGRRVMAQIRRLVDKAADRGASDVFREHVRQHHPDVPIDTLEDILDQLQHGRRP